MAQSYVNGTSPTVIAEVDPLRSPLKLGGPRLRAFTGGLVTSAGVTVLFDPMERAVVLVVTALICTTIAVWPIRATHLWHSPFLSGLGLGLLLTGTFLWVRPHETGTTGEWLIAIAVGSLLFWVLPGRRGRPVFLLTMLMAAMIGAAVWGADATIDGTDHVVWRLLDSIEPSVVTLIVFAVAYTLYGMALDQWERRGGGGTFFVAAMIGAGWAMIIAIRSSESAVLVALLLTGMLMLIAGTLGGRPIVLHGGLLIIGVSAVSLVNAPERTNDVHGPELPDAIYIGLLLILFGVLLGRGAHGD